MIPIKRKWKIIIALFLLPIAICLGLLIGSFFIFGATGRTGEILNPLAIVQAVSEDSKHLLLTLLLSASFWVGGMVVCFWKRTTLPGSISTVKLTPKIIVPAAAGQGQYGTARLTTEEEQRTQFKTQIISTNEPVIKELILQGQKDFSAIIAGEVVQPVPISEAVNGYKSGVPIAYYKLSKSKEEIALISGDLHTITFGATRCGKTRTLVMQSICIQGLAGADMLNIDPKGGATRS